MSHSSYRANRDEITVRVRSLRGETIDLSVPKTCTIGELLSFLIVEYRYSDKTCLLYNSVPADVNTYVADYPYDSLMIAVPQHNLALHTQGHRPQSTQPFVAPNGNNHTQSCGRGPWQQQQPSLQMSEPQHFPVEQQGQRAEKVQNSTRSSLQTAPKHSYAPSITRLKSDAPEKEEKQTPSASRADPHALFLPESEPSTEPVGLSTLAQKPRMPKRGNRGTESGVAQCSAKPARNHENFSGRASSAHGSTHTKASARSTAKNSPSSLCTAEATSVSGADNSGVRGFSEGRPTPRQPSRLMIHCCVPAQRRSVNVELSSDASVADLMLSIVAEVPEAATGKLVFRGKVLPQTPESSLFNVGIRSDCTVFVASGEYSNVDLIILEKVEMNVSRIERDIENATTDLQRKGYYEELMRILFCVDGLQNLEGQWKQKRKDMVRRITDLQDKLNVDTPGSVVEASTNTDSRTTAFSSTGSGE